MSLKIEEIRDLLAQKLSVEKKRLKTFGTKTDSFQMANVICRYVQSFMSYARYKEMKRLDKLLNKLGSDDQDKVTKYVKERIKATRRMSKAIKHEAERVEKIRPWKRTVEKHKHKHRSKNGK